jgi:organic hydroperoxide reductase OsmC/OhrA
MSKSHRYATTLTWTGNTGEGTASYRSYERAYEVAAEGKPALLGSSDPSFRGDPARWNPEELLLASISSCHQL